MVLFLEAQQAVDNAGQPVGLAYASQVKTTSPVILAFPDSFSVFDLSYLDPDGLKEEQWAPINPSDIYNSVQYWFRK